MALRGEPRGSGWMAAADLFGAQLPQVLADVGEARGTTSTAVAATLLLDVYAQRVAAPVLAALHVEGTVLDASLPAVRVEPAGPGIRRLAFAHDPQPVEDPRAAHASVRRGLIDEHLAIAVDVLHRQTRAGVRVLRGTLANAVAISFLHLSWPGPDRDRFVGAAEAFLDTAGLTGLATIASVPEGGEPWMYTDRTTCCLAFRTSVNQERDEPYCATCPVIGRARTRALFGQATASYRDRQG